MSTKMISLGTTNIKITPMGTGAWQWGDRTLWGFGNDYGTDDVRDAFEASLSGGINFYDTAEAYGMGKSEKLLGRFIKASGKPVVVATKFMPYPWRLIKSSLVKALRSSLKRLELPRVDLYQIHWPTPPISIETWADGLADAFEAGLTNAVGVSNYSEGQMRRMHARLAQRGIHLTSNQVKYSLLDRKVEFNGLLKACQELGITMIAYSPIEKGMLSGKYSPDRLPPGLRRRKYNMGYVTKIQPLLRLMQNIGNEYGGKTPAQVALNWCIAKGVVPIPGAKNSRQAQENNGGLGWHLSEEHIAALDEASMIIQ